MRCPIEQVHGRLQAAHRMWHHALTDYQDPDAFRTYLNACIEALRSVTFVLQSHKAVIPSFDPWYAEWQTKMRTDGRMRWLVEARNTVVKQGDLATASRAVIRITDAYLQRPEVTQEVDPFLSLDQVVMQVRLGRVAQHTVQHGTLTVERRWTVHDLPDQEVLDILAYNFGVLRSLTRDAHRQLGWEPDAAVQCDGRKTFGEGHEPVRHQDELPCMRARRNERSIHIRLGSGTPVSPVSTTVARDDSLKASIEARYATRQVPEPPEASTPLSRLAEIMYVIGQQILVADGYHLPTAILHYPDGSYSINQLLPEDRSEKYLLMEQLADEVSRRGATGVVFIAESWIAPFDQARPYRPAAESPDRSEVLSLAGIGANGEAFSWLTNFARNGNEIVLGERRATRGSSNAFLNPVRRVWGLPEVLGP